MTFYDRTCHDSGCSSIIKVIKFIARRNTYIFMIECPYLWDSFSTCAKFSEKLTPPVPHTSLSSPTPTPTVLSIGLFLWLHGWSRHIWCAISLNDNLDLHMLSLGTLVPEGPWYVLYTKGLAFTEIWHIMWFFTGTLISHTQTHSTLRGQYTDTSM